MKIIAFYLPQFHEIEENNIMWGKGFTEWTNVKRAVPLFEGHEQPVVPLGGDYYDLTDIEVMRRQAALAKEHGVYGFCFYHYWYNGHKLLEKPVDAYLRETSIDLPFCIAWANHNWENTWSPEKGGTLRFVQNYGDKAEWKQHIDYLLPFLKDPRYIRTNGKPLLVIYEPANIPEMNEMLDLWQEEAKKAGLEGIDFAFQCVTGDAMRDFDDSRFAYDIEYQPMYVRELGYFKKNRNSFMNTVGYYKKKLLGKYNRSFSVFSRLARLKKAAAPEGPTVVDYDEIWERVLAQEPLRPTSVPGAFVRMDTTPRKGRRGFVTQGMTPEKFGGYLRRMILRCREVYRKDMLFLFAWNEWDEGGYIEPDEKYGTAVLEQIRRALEETNELPPRD